MSDESGGRQRMKRWWGACSLVLAGMLASCGGGGGAKSSEQDPGLADKLLTVSDLPAGWAKDSSESKSKASGCLGELDKDDADARAKASFVKGDYLPTLTEELSSYESDAARRFDEAVVALSDCSEATITAADGTKGDVKIGEMSFPEKGDDSVAFQYRFEVEGFSFAAGAVYVRVGSTFVSVALINLGDVRVDELERFVDLVLDKVD